MSAGRRIIHVPRRFAQHEWGRTENVLLHLCQEQLAAGCMPEIHTSRALSDTAQEVWMDIPIRRYKHAYVRTGLSTLDRQTLDLHGGDLVSLPFFFRQLQDRKVDLYHAHTVGRLGGEVLTLARLMKKPLVVTIHDPVFHQAAPEEELSSDASKSFDWGRPFDVLFRSQQVLREAAAVICVEHAAYQAACDALGSERVHFLPNGLSEEALMGGDGPALRAKLEIDASARVFGCIAPIDPEKDQLTLVKAFSRLHKRNPDIRLILAGRVSRSAYDKSIREEIARQGVQEFVRILGPVEAESREHRDLLAAFDVCVQPSVQEASGMAALAAWSAGKPVIASCVGGLQQVIAHEQDGLLFDAGDREELARAMQALAKDPELCSDLAAGGGHKLAHTYSWSRVAEQMDAIYTAVGA